MGGRGTYAAGKKVGFTFKTIGRIEGIKVLSGINGTHGLPEESHTSSAYIQINKDGTFREMRFYDRKHYLKLEIALHPEPNIGNGKSPVLHYHVYDKNFNRSTAKKATRAMEKFVMKYIKGKLQ